MLDKLRKKRMMKVRRTFVFEPQVLGLGAPLRETSSNQSDRGVGERKFEGGLCAQEGPGDTVGALPGPSTFFH